MLQQAGGLRIPQISGEAALSAGGMLRVVGAYAADTRYWAHCIVPGVACHCSLLGSLYRVTGVAYHCSLLGSLWHVTARYTGVSRSAPAYPQHEQSH